MDEQTERVKQTEGERQRGTNTERLRGQTGKLTERDK